MVEKERLQDNLENAARKTDFLCQLLGLLFSK